MLRRLRAFTLLELIVAIVILGVLAALAIPTFSMAIKRSKLETAEVTAAAFARETLALAALDGRSTPSEADATAAAADLPSASALSAGSWADPFAGYQVVFGAWEFSGDARTISARLSSDVMGVAVLVPGAGCAYAKTESNSVKWTWSVVDAAVTDCSGSAAVALTDPDAVPIYGAPPVPAGLGLSYGMCGADPGWSVSWDSGAVDIYVNGRYVGAFTGGACLANTLPTDVITVLERDPSTPDGVPSGWDGGPGDVTGGGTETGGSDPLTPVIGTSVSTSPSDGETVKLVWDASNLPEGTTSLVIDRSSSGGSTSFTVSDPSSGVYYDSSVSSGSDYTYQGQPMNGSTPAGPPVSLTLTRVTASDPVTAGASPTLSVSGLDVTLSWGAVADTAYAPLSGYRVYASSAASGPWAQAGEVTKVTTSYAFPSMSAGTHCFAVSSWGPGGESALSSPVCANLVAPATPGAVLNTAEVSFPTSSITSTAYFGDSVAVDGDTMAIGADQYQSGKGGVFMYQRTNGAWALTQVLQSSDMAAGDKFGSKVALDGNQLAVSATGKDSSRGAVYVFTRSGGVWSQQAKLVAPDGAANDLFGTALDIEGTKLVIGAPYNTSTGANGGAVYYSNYTTSWSAPVKMVLSGYASYVYYGSSVSLDADRLAVGAPLDGNGRGAVYMYASSGSAWALTQKIAGPNSNATQFPGGSYIGASVSLHGSDLMVMRSQTASTSTDLMWHYTLGSSWTLQDSFARYPKDATDGQAMAFDGTTLLLGFRYYDADGNASGEGAVATYTQQGGTWSQRDFFVSPEKGSSFGAALAIDGSTAIVGAPSSDLYGTDFGRVMYLSIAQ